MKGKLIGFGIFVLVAIMAISVYLFSGNHAKGSAIIVKGYAGGEKMDFLADPEITALLKKKYNITVDATKAGSIEMIDMTGEKVDFLFPSSQTALEMFEAKGKTALKKERIFSSPIVFYTWDSVYSALEKEGMVQKDGNTSYVKNLSALIDAILDNKKWSEIGVDIYGSVKVISTDPNKSNSGLMFAGLLANILNGGQVAGSADIEALLPNIQSVFAKLGQMESSSANLFATYLTLGLGNSPIVAGYENQMVEFALQNPEIWNKAKDRVVILYPEPTVWSEHYFIALSENGKRLCEALLDKEIQKLAWTKHGFRTGLLGSDADESIMEGVGIPDSITQVVPVPNADVMQTIQNYLAQ